MVFVFSCVADGREVVESVSAVGFAEVFGKLCVVMDACWLSWDLVSTVASEVSHAC